jgi:predicted amidohydrolase YtcJ
MWRSGLTFFLLLSIAPAEGQSPSKTISRHNYELWSETTAATIFPNRKIGRLKDGFEASFLVLGGNPVEDFLNTSRIEMRVKQGEILTLK